MAQLSAFLAHTFLRVLPMSLCTPLLPLTHGGCRNEKGHHTVEGVMAQARCNGRQQRSWCAKPRSSLHQVAQSPDNQHYLCHRVPAAHACHCLAEKGCALQGGRGEQGEVAGWGLPAARLKSCRVGRCSLLLRGTPKARGSTALQRFEEGMASCLSALACVMLRTL